MTKNNTDKRDAWIKLRVTIAERDKITKKAKRARKSLSAYMRDRALMA